MTSRAIVDEIETVLNRLQHQHRVVEINAPTGYGKSTLVPPLIYLRNNSRTLFLVPNVTAVHRLKDYVIALKFEGLNIGYAAASEKHYDDSNNYVIATYGHGYQLALSALEGMKTGKIEGLSQFGNVIFDEYHHRDEHIPAVAGIYHYIIDRDLATDSYRLIHRAFFMTATAIGSLPGGMESINSNYRLKLELGSGSIIKYVEAYRDPGGKFDLEKVDPKQLNNILKKTAETIAEVLGVIPTVAVPARGTPSSRGGGSNRGGKTPVPQSVSSEKSLPTTHEGMSIKRNAILVFLPGRGEIKKTRDYLRAIKNLPANLEIIEFHSKSSDADAARLKTLPPNVIRVILATNVFETAVTIDYLDVVIDTMLEKVMIFDTTKQSKSLILEYIYKNSSKQRAGRVGRNRVGLVIRIISRINFDSLPDSKPNSIETDNIDKLVVEMTTNSPRGGSGVESPDIIMLTYMGVTRRRITESLNHAVDLGLMQNDNGTYTMIDIRLMTIISDIPLDLLPAYFLAKWIGDEKYPIYVGIVLACLMDSNIRYININADPDLVAEFLEKNDLWSYGIMGESIKIWLYATANSGTTKLEEWKMREIFKPDPASPEVIDIPELKRLSRSISSCVGIITGLRRNTYANERRDVQTTISSYVTELKKSGLSEPDQVSMTAGLRENRAREKVLDKIIERPIEVAMFDSEYSIRALGYFLQVKLNIARTARAVEKGKLLVLQEDDTKVQYFVPEIISKMMRMKKGWEYVIIGSIIINGQNQITLIIPTYHQLDIVINKRINRIVSVPEPVKQYTHAVQTIPQRLYSRERRPDVTETGTEIPTQVPQVIASTPAQVPQRSYGRDRRTDSTVQSVQPVQVPQRSYGRDRRPDSTTSSIPQPVQPSIQSVPPPVQYDDTLYEM